MGKTSFDGCQGGDLVDDHHHQWLIKGRGVKSGVPAQPCCASAHEIWCRPKQREGCRSRCRMQTY